MDYGETASSIGTSAGNGLSSERPRSGDSWLFFIWPVRERLADL